MMRSRSNALGFVMAALFCGPMWGAASPQPGAINYLEGQASMGGYPLRQNAVGSVTLGPGQVLTTQDGRAEILLTPGIFLRIAGQSAIQMVSPGLANTVVTLQHGRALVEVAQILPQNNVVINANGASARLLKPGLYDFDADHGVIRVFDGKVSIPLNGKTIELNGDHQLMLNGAAPFKTSKFDKVSYQDDFYRWASLRSSYLTEANVDAARRYAGATGYAPGLWYGAGWYWDPWYSAYTFIPGDGVFFTPFGWGFYSPGFAFGAPYFGFGFGGYHYFGPGYRPAIAAGRGFYASGGTVGHAFSYRGAGFGSRGFGGGGFRGNAGAMRGAGGGGRR
jgi:hypothetical protein